MTGKVCLRFVFRYLSESESFSVLCYCCYCQFVLLLKWWFCYATEIGLGLTAFGVFFSFLGIMFVFDKGLLAMGNVSYLYSCFFSQLLLSTPFFLFCCSFFRFFSSQGLVLPLASSLPCSFSPSVRTIRFLFLGFPS